MVIHFCDKCGHRVPQGQLDNGTAIIRDESRAVCAGCIGPRSSRRAAAVQAATASTEAPARKSGINIPPASRSSATHKAPTPAHVSKVSAHHAPPQEGANKTLIYVGAGIVAVSIILAFAVMGSGPSERRAAPGDSVATSTGARNTTPSVPKIPSTVTTTSSVTTVTPVTPVTPVVPVTPVAPVSTKPDNDYDPRAAVAQSLLTQAKAQATSDPWAYHDLLKDLVARYARTKAAEEAAKLLADWKTPPQQAPPGQGKPRLDGSADTDLLLGDALSWRCGHTGQARDGLSIDGKPLRIGSRSFEKGIGFHSSGELKYDLGGHYRWLSGYLGIDAETAGQGSVGFEIWLDGKKAHDTGVLRGSDEARFFKLPVDGIRRVLIVVTNGGDNDGCDHADLCGLRLGIGTEEPREDDIPTSAPPTTTETTVATTEVAAPTKPDPVPPAADAEALARQAYARFLNGFLGAMREKGWTVARSRLETATKEPQLASYAETFKADRELLTFAEKAWAAVPKGAAVLADGRPFTLVQTDGTLFTVGTGSKTRVLKVTGTDIEIEQNLGGGKMGLRVPCAKLTFDCSLALARLGLPEDAEGKLALVLMKWLRPDAELTEQQLRKVADEAESAKAQPAGVAQLRKWTEVFAKEGAARQALTALEELIEQKSGKEALAAFEALKKDHLDTAFWADLQPNLPELDKKLAMFRLEGGLWASYWSGDEIDRFRTLHFARVENKLVLEWGDGQCDPRVPGDNFGVRMGGLLVIPESGRYAFVAHSDDLMKVWLDGNLITETKCNEQTAELDLQAGEHAINVEFMEYHGGASMRLRWRPPGVTDVQEIPADILRYRPDQKDEYQKSR